MTNEIKNKIFWYSRNWYGTTGDTLEDLKIILNDNHYINNWKYQDAVMILMNNFGDLFEKELVKILNGTIFDWYQPEKDIKEKLLEELLSIISLKDILVIKSIMEIDEKYKDMYDLKGMNK